VKLTTVAVPEGEDVNSLLQTHDDPRVLADLIRGPKGIFFFTRKRKSRPLPKSPTPATLAHD
jgi:DNA primase